jgi:ATP-dependent helicase/nuclease subunit B
MQERRKYMNKFLDKLAEYITARYGDGIPDLTIVLPNRRGGLYLKKYLGARLKRTTWAPAIFSIEDFIIRLSGLKLAENTRVLFELYEVHRMLEGKNAQPFEEFVTWGQQLLSDFNEIDSYLTDAGKLFRYLDEARVLSTWNLDGKPLTDFEKNYLHFYNSLSSYYEQLTARLVQDGAGYPGLIFRQAALTVEERKETLGSGKVIFAGFNALTAAEEKIIDDLVMSGKAEILWDADHYYLKNVQQEAGDFLRRWRNKWSQGLFNWTADDLSGSEKNIHITGVPQHIGQARLAGQVLKDLLEARALPSEIAVVLMDEQLLVPLLSSLPNEVRELNITMGLPLDRTPLYDLLDDLFRMQVNTSRFTHAKAGGTERFYFRDVLKILQHPYMNRVAGHILGSNAFAFRDRVAGIRNGGKVFLKKEDISGTDLFPGKTDFPGVIFTAWKDPAAAMDCLREVTGLLRDAFIASGRTEEDGRPGRETQIELEYLYAFSKIIHQLDSLVTRYNTIGNIRALQGLFARIAGASVLPFYGEPLKGVQLMGMLETRTLDFENVILLSANEDLLPSGKTSSSFIPYDIRRDFHLPTHHHKNAVYAYHFYRLLQRAKNVWYIYNTEPDELGGGDKSRFIRQVTEELQRVNPKVTLSGQVMVTPPVKGITYPPIIIPKTGEVHSGLMKKAADGLSPTTINNFRLCPLRFYFSAIAGLEEQKEPEDAIDPQVLGLAVHKALQDLYKPVLGNVITTAMIREMIENSDKVADEAFRLKYQGSDVTYGKNLLLVRVGKIMIRRFLQAEMQRVEELSGNGKTLTVTNVEFPVSHTVALRTKNGELTVKIRGFIDREERAGDDLRIIDYKTGTVDGRKLRIDDWTTLSGDPGLTMIFQLLTYAWITGKLSSGSFAISAGIMPLKKISDGFLEVTVPAPGEGQRGSLLTEVTLKAFEEILMGTVADILDADKPFTQTDDTDVCRTCPYINLCGR